MQFKYLLFFAICLLVRLNAFSQSSSINMFDNDKVIFGGFTFGMNVSQVDGDGFSGYNKVGFNIGPSGMIKFSKTLSASIELLWSQKGSVTLNSTENIYVGSITERYRMHINYAEVPVLLNYHYGNRLIFSVGGSYSQYISHKETQDGLYARQYESELYPMNKFYLDYVISGKYILLNHLYLEMRFQKGITALRNNEHVPEDYNRGQDQFNNMFAFKLGYIL